MPDVIVVGAGVIGLSIAWRLAQEKINVAVLDSGVAGGQASTAAAGMLAPGGEIKRRTEWSQFALDSFRLYPSFVNELQVESDTSIEFRRCGGVELAYSEREWAQLVERAATQKLLGVQTDPVTGTPLVSLIPGLELNGLVGAMLYPEDALIDPHHLIRALHAACISRDVPVRQQVPVLGLRFNPGVVEVRTDEGVLHAAVAILSAGAWSSSIPIEGAEVPRCGPAKGHLLAYNLNPGSLMPILRHGETYILQRAGGFTIAGSSVEDVGFDSTVNTAVAAQIAARAKRMLPLPAVPSKVWTGFRPRTEVGGPQIGRYLDTPLWLAYGHYRNGILMAPGTAARVASDVIAYLRSPAAA